MQSASAHGRCQLRDVLCARLDPGWFLCPCPSWLFTAWVAMPWCSTEGSALEALCEEQLCVPCSLLAVCSLFGPGYLLGFRGACAQLSKRMPVPSRVCSKHLGASSKKQPQPCCSCCQLSWAGRAKSLRAKGAGKNRCVINESIGN